MTVTFSSQHHFAEALPSSDTGVHNKRGWKKQNDEKEVWVPSAMKKLCVVVVKSSPIIAAEAEVQCFIETTQTAGRLRQAGVSLSSGLTEAILKLSH